MDDIKKCRIFSIEVNNFINKLKNTNYGIYHIKDMMTCDDEDLFKLVINFIDNNLFIKNTLGKSIRSINVIDSNINLLEVYDCNKTQEAINKASGSYFVG